MCISANISEYKGSDLEGSELNADIDHAAVERDGVHWCFLRFAKRCMFEVFAVQFYEDLNMPYLALDVYIYWQCECLKASSVWLSINLSTLFLPADSIGPGQRDWDPVQYNRSWSRPASQWRLHHRPCDWENVCHQTSGQRGKSLISCKCCSAYRVYLERSVLPCSHFI